MIEKFKQKRLEGETIYKRKRNPATVNRELWVLSKIFSLAFDAELIDSNPCRRVRKFRTDTRRTRYLTFDEEARLFEKLEGQEWVQRIVTMAINTGMRQGEIFDLTWFDVDLMRGLIHVRVSKNGKDRFVPINQTIRTMLERLPRTRPALEITAFTTCATRLPLEWRTAEPMRSRWPKSSDGQTSERLCATRTLPTSQSAEQLKIWSSRLDQVTNR